MKRFRLRSWRARLIMVAILFGLIALKLHVEYSDSVASSKTLDKLLATLTQDRITYLTDQGGCRLLATRTVAYMEVSRSWSDGECRPPDGKTIPFDQRGEELFRAARRAIGAARVDVVMLAVRYDAGDTVTSADVVVKSHLGHSWYVYTPKSPLLSYHKGTVTQIGNGWVFLETE